MLWWLGTMEKIRKGLKRDVEVQRGSKGGQAKLESQSKSSWNPIRILGTVGTKIVTQIAYQLRFGRSLYGWKAKRINLPMELVFWMDWASRWVWCAKELLGFQAALICWALANPTWVGCIIWYQSHKKPQKCHKKVDLFLITYKHFEPFVVTI
jgi:hypothetical protein